LPRFPKTRSAPVGAVMDPDPLTVPPDAPATRLRRLFRSTGARVVYVVSRDGRLLGWVTRGEILYVTSSKSAATAAALMAEPPVKLGRDTPVGAAVEALLAADEWYAPVLGPGGRLAGSLGLEHVISSMLAENPEALAGVEAEEVMTREPVAARAGDSVARVWELMREHRYSGLPVVDDRGRLVGVITVYDLLASGSRPAFESPSGPARAQRVSEVMTRAPVYLYPWSRLVEAAELMVKRGFGRVPVVASERTRRLAGIIDREDIARLVLEG